MNLGDFSKQIKVEDELINSIINHYYLEKPAYVGRAQKMLFA